jgi:hypothetical protein
MRTHNLVKANHFFLFSLRYNGLHFTLPTMAKHYPCLNPDCPTEYMQSRSLNHHYACNPAYSMFVHHVGFDDLQHFAWKHWHLTAPVVLESLLAKRQSEPTL